MKYTIVGGGISGLAAAHYLTKIASTSKVTILEAASRLGGWIETTKSQDGYIFEHGPRTVRPAGPQGANTLELIGMYQ
jgi:oxygen-dependent protoporphyrinogen oxidase